MDVRVVEALQDIAKELKAIRKLLLEEGIKAEMQVELPFRKGER
jgi:hypothetical protein